MQLPAKVADLLSTLNSAGHEAYVVGGCVRDTLMSRPPGDFDITTSATPQQVKALFRRTVDTGIAHGTVTVLMGSKSYEVTTFRLDGEYTDNRRPNSVTFTSSLPDDLSRRDFTMNAIAYHPDTGFVDPFVGTSDIAAGYVRCVGDPSRRFSEDALRMLRAVRFSAQLGFAIEPDTFGAITQHAHTLANVSAERICVELVKLLCSEGTDRFSDLLATGLWQAADPPSLAYFAEHFHRTKPLLTACDPNINNRLSLLLLHMDGSDVTRFLKRFKFSNQTIKTVCILVDGASRTFSTDVYSVRKALGFFGRELLENILYIQQIVASEAASHASPADIVEVLHQIDIIHSNGDAYTIGALAIDGNTLKRLGFSEGAKIGAALNRLLDEVCRDPLLNQPDKLTTLALQLKNN